MFFLLRMAFWLALILLILPIGTSSDGGRQIGAWQALSAAQSVVADARGFCQRQPDACEVGGEMFSHILDKAQMSAKWLYDNFGSHSGTEAPRAPDSAHGGSTLTPQDLLPGWGGEPAAPAGAAPQAPSFSVPLPQRRPA